MTGKRKLVSTSERCCTNIRPQKRPVGKVSAAYISGAYGKRSLLSGYEAVLCVDMYTRETEVLHQKSAQVARVLQEMQGIHREELWRVSGGKISHYEWSMPDKDEILFYQTTLIPLGDCDGQTARVLSLTRNISLWNADGHKDLLCENNAHAKTFAQMLLAAREEEKKIICKALHDELGSSAVMLSSLLHIAQSSVEQGQRTEALNDLQELNKQLQLSLERLKNVIITLRPPTLECDGALGGSIRELLENTGHYLDIPFEFKYSPRLSEKGISDNVKIVLYRVVQEALSNIAKHSRAKHITVSLRKQKFTLYLTVCDDGVGFRPRMQRSIKHIGLLAMKDSVRLLGGRISIKSAPGKGTRIAVSCPSTVYEVNYENKDCFGG